MEFDFNKEFSTPIVESPKPSEGAQPKENSEQPQPQKAPILEPEEDVFLQRGVESSEGSAFGSFDFGELIADGMQELNTRRKDAETGIENKGQNTVIQLDVVSASAAAVFYTDVIVPTLIEQLGSLVIGEEYKYKGMGKAFDKAYRETAASLAASGKITLPTEMQCFVAMTLFILASNAFTIFGERKKKKQRAEKTNVQAIRRKMVDEAQPVDVSFSQSISGPIESNPTVECTKRGKFATESGFYIFDLDNVYIKKNERKYGPSTIAKDVLKTLTKAGEIREAIKAKLK